MIWMAAPSVMMVVDQRTWRNLAHRPITLIMLSDRGNSLLYPILAKAASALTSTELRMMMAGALQVRPGSRYPDLTDEFRSIWRQHDRYSEIDEIHARWSAARQAHIDVN